MSYVITGSPGTGKHTIGMAISQTLNLPILDINRIAGESNLVHNGDVDTDMLADTINIERPSIIIGHLAPYVISPKHDIKKAIVLRRSPYELDTIYKNRQYSRQKALDNLGAEILDIIYTDARDAFGSVIQIDITGNATEHNTQRVLQAMTQDPATPNNNGSDKVNWLHTISVNGDTGRFFELNK